MRIELKSFRTKVARRIFLLFILCAVVPTSALALVSYIQVRKELSENTRSLLFQQSKNVAISLFDRLILLSDDLHMVGAYLGNYPKEARENPPEELKKILEERFRGLTLFDPEGTVTVRISGTIDTIPSLSKEQMGHLSSGLTMLIPGSPSKTGARFILCKLLDPRSPEKGLLAGEIETSFLWISAEMRPPDTGIAVLDGSKELLYGAFPGDERPLYTVLKNTDLSHSGHLEWGDQNGGYVVCYRFMGLKARFFTQGWYIVLARSKGDALDAMKDFRKLYPVILIFSLGLVILLSIAQIRRSTVPIDQLKDATRQISQGALGHQVHISSHDEYETLGESFNDMSRKLREIQSLLVQAAKMGTMGQMAAGIVHEIKQPLTAIYGLLQILLLDMPEGENKKHLETMGQAVERLNGILQKFRSFSQKSEEKFGPLSLKLIVSQVQQLLEHLLLMKRIQCATEHEDRLPLISGDNQGLQQVVSNLMINAMDALEDVPGDRRIITLKTYTSGDGVCLEVGDKGIGIPEKDLKHIFDPFFTTKDPDKGTGLGLAIIDSILHRHHARIRVTSEVGVGTTFSIWFPPLAGNTNQGSAPSRNGSA